MWFLFVIGALATSVVSKLLFKKTTHDAPVIFAAIVTQLIGGVVMGAYYLAFGTSQPIDWASTGWLVCASVFLWSVIAVWSLIGIRDTEVSLREVLVQSRTLLVVFLSALVLGEHVSQMSWLGIALIISGIIFATYKPAQKLSVSMHRGTWYVLATSALIAVVSLIDKKASALMDPSLYAAIVYAGPAVVLLAFLYKRFFKECSHATKKGAWLVTLAAGTINSIGFFFTLYTYRALDLHIAYPILQTSSIFALIAGIIFWNERERAGWKFFGLILALIGALMCKW